MPQNIIRFVFYFVLKMSCWVSVSSLFSVVANISLIWHPVAKLITMSQRQATIVGTPITSSSKRICSHSLQGSKFSNSVSNKKNFKGFFFENLRSGRCSQHTGIFKSKRWTLIVSIVVVLLRGSFCDFV